jgi:hypothetical protein
VDTEARVGGRVHSSCDPPHPIGGVRYVGTEGGTIPRGDSPVRQNAMQRHSGIHAWQREGPTSYPPPPLPLGILRRRGPRAMGATGERSLRGARRNGACLASRRQNEKNIIISRPLRPPRAGRACCPVVWMGFSFGGVYQHTESSPATPHEAPSEHGASFLLLLVAKRKGGASLRRGFPWPGVPE